jgi:long-chain acyl-CoA synthetase
VPTHFIRILALPDAVRRKYDLSSIKMILHSAAPCPRDVKSAIIELFPPNTIWEVYGGTEGAMTMISPQEWVQKPGSVGRPFPPGTVLRIFDQEGNEQPTGQMGLVYARSALNFRYRGAPQLDTQTWRGDMFTLGDVGYLDEDGYLFITDRIKDMIISGGANIYPAEVEAVLFNHPAVGDTAVIGVPDSHWGERVKAIVEPRAETTEEDIIAFCREHLAHYKCPTSVDFIERLPRDPSGKIRKRELREKYWAGAGRAV